MDRQELAATRPDEVQPEQLRARRDEVERLVILALDARLIALQGVQRYASEEGSDPAKPHGSLHPVTEERVRAYWNAFTLISIFGAIEGHIEALGQGMRDIVTQAHAQQRSELAKMNRQRNVQLRREGQLPEGAYSALNALSHKVANWFLANPNKRLPHDLPSADKWEDALRRIYLFPVAGRPVPNDLRETVNELGEVRHVILHRMSRIDGKALERVSEGPWRTRDEEVIINSALYKRYIAALMAYHCEIHDRVRSRLGVPPVHDLTRWREMVPAGG